MTSHPSLQLLAGVLAVAAAPGWQLRAEPPKMPELTAMARLHDLPMPPAEARLVLAHTESRRVLGNRSSSRDPAIYAPAFLLGEDADGTVTILRGTERHSLTPRPGGEKLYLPWSLDHVVPKEGGHVADFGRLSAFVCAVQLAVRGDEQLALRLWARAEEDDYIGETDFLAAFLGDSAVRNAEGKDRKKFEGPCAAFTIPVISVRDFAAIQIASIVDLPDAPDEFWTAAQWAELRTKVQAAVEGMKLPSFDAGGR